MIDFISYKREQDAAEAAYDAERARQGKNRNYNASMFYQTD